MMKQNIILFAVSAVWLISSCGKCENGGRTEHHFDLPLKISPSGKIYNTGDTIFLESIFSHDIKNPNKAIRVENFDFRTVMTIVDLNTPSHATSYKNPKIITLIGTTTGTNIGTLDYQAISINYKYEYGEYRYKALFILEQKGKYLISLTSDLSGRRDDIDFTSCPNEAIKLTYNTNDRQNNNFDMLKDAVDEYYASWSRQEFDEVGGYCFEVK